MYRPLLISGFSSYSLQIYGKCRWAFGKRTSLVCSDGKCNNLQNQRHGVLEKYQVFCGSSNKFSERKHYLHKTRAQENQRYAYHALNVWLPRWLLLRTPPHSVVNIYLHIWVLRDQTTSSTLAYCCWQSTNPRLYSMVVVAVLDCTSTAIETCANRVGAACTSLSPSTLVSIPLPQYQTSSLHSNSHPPQHVPVSFHLRRAISIIRKFLT